MHPGKAKADNPWQSPGPMRADHQRPGIGAQISARKRKGPVLPPALRASWSDAV
jgi:hypothetical protein